MELEMNRVYQYNGVASWITILSWCGKNLDGRFYCNDRDTITFTDDGAYAWFLLRWS